MDVRLARFASPVASTRRELVRNRMRRLRRKMLFESLEDRSVMTAWVGPATGGLWSNAANWMDGDVPNTAAETADFPAGVTSVSVDAAGSPFVIGGISFADTGLTLTAGGGSLTITAGPGITDAAGGNTIAAPISLSGATPVNVAAGNLSLTGIVSGASGSITKQGAGTLTLSGVNTYGGGTTISAGAVSTGVAAGLGSGANSTVINNGVLNLTNNSASTTYLFQGMSGAGTVNFTVGTGTTTSSGFTAPTGAVTWSTFTGTIEVGLGAAPAAGRMNFTNLATLPSTATINVNPNASIVATSGVHNAQLKLNGGNTGESNGQLRLDTGANYAGTITLLGVMDPADGRIGSLNGTGIISGIITDGGDTLPLTKSGPGSVMLSGPNTYDGPTTVISGPLQFANPGALYGGLLANWNDTNLIVNSAATLGFNIGGTGEFTEAQVQSLADISSATGGYLPNSILGVDISNAPGAVYTWSSLIENPPSGNAVGFNKLGAGTLTLTAANTYTGPTVPTGGILNAGTANINGSNAAGAIVFAGGTLQAATGGIHTAQQVNTTFGAGTFDTNGNDSTLSGNLTGTNPFTKAGTGTLTLAGAANALTGTTGTLNISGGVLDLSTDLGLAGSTMIGGTGGTINGTAGGRIRINNGTGDIGVSSGAGTTTINAVIAGGSANTVDFFGTGTVVLNGANTFTGTPNIQGGIISVPSIGAAGTAGPLGSGGTINLGSTTNTPTLRYTGAGETVTRVLNLSSTTGTVTVENAGAGALRFMGANTATGAGAKTLVLTGTGDFELAGNLDNSATNRTSISKQGTGTWTLSAAGTYSGTTTIANGKLVATADSVLPNAAVIMGSIGAGVQTGTVGTLDLTNGSQTVASLTVVSDSLLSNSILIGAGKNLAVNATTGNSVAVGVSPNSNNNDRNTYTNLVVSGAGSMSVANTTGNMRVGVPNSTAADETANISTLDLSALAGGFTYTATTGQLLVGLDTGTGGTSVPPPVSGNILTLSNATNTLTAATLSIGDNTHAVSSSVRLGTGVNNLNFNTISLAAGAGRRGNGELVFSAAGGTGLTTIRNQNGDGPATLNIGVNSTGTGSLVTGKVDLTGHNVNALFSTVDMGNNSGAPTVTYTNTFSFDTGSLTIGTLKIGTKTAAGTGTNDNTVTIGGGTTVINDVLVATSTGSAGTSLGKLNLNGGNVTINGVFTIASTSAAGVATGTVTVAGATVNVANGITLGNRTSTGGTNASLIITGGSITVGGDIVETGNGSAASTVTLNGGTLDMAAKILGSGANAINTLNWQSGTLKDIAQINAGATGLTKTTTGTLTLAGSNAYTGTTTVNAGTLKWGNNNAIAAAAPAVVLNATGAGTTALLDLNNFDDTIGTLNLGGTTTTSQANVATGTGTLTVSDLITYTSTNNPLGSTISGKLNYTNPTGIITVGDSTSAAIDLTISAAISGAAVGLTKEGAGRLMLSGMNTYTAPTTLNTGSLQFGARTALYGGNTANWTPANLVVKPGLMAVFNVGGVGEFTAADIDIIKGLGSATGGFMGTSTLGLDTSNATNPFVYGGNFANTDGGANVINLAKLGAGTLTLTGNSTYSGTTSVQNGTLEVGATNALPFDTTVSIGTSDGSAGTLSLVNADQTIGALNIDNNSTTLASNLNIAAGRTLTVSGNVRIGSNLAANTTTLLNTSGGGTLTVAAIGGTFAVGGTTSSASQGNKANADLSGLSTLNVNLGSTGTFRVNPTNSNAVNDKYSTLTLPGTGAGNSTIIANLLSVGDGAQNNGSTGQLNSLRLGTGVNTLRVNTLSIGNGTRDVGSITFASPTNGSLIVRDLAGTGRATFNMAASSGATALLSASPNIFDVTGHNANLLLNAVTIGSQLRGNNYTNNFAFNQGTLDMNTLVMSTRAGDTATGPGNPRTVTSTLDIGGGNVLINNGITKLAELTGGGFTNATQDHAAIATINITGGTVVVGPNGSGVSVTMGNMNVTETVVVPAVPNVADVSTSGTINITGGNVTFLGNIVKGGQAAVTTGAVATNAALNINGGTVNMSGKEIGPAAALLNSLTFASGTLQNVAQINNGAGLTKTGTGQLILAGTNTYTGPTTVTGGKLVVDGTTAAGSPVTVNTGGSLGGTGTIAGAVATAGTGSIDAGAAGSTAGTLAINTNTLTLAPTSTFAAQLGGAAAGDGAGFYDQVVVGGDVNLGGATLDVSLNSYLPAVNDVFTLIDKTTAGPVTGMLSFASNLLAEGASFVTGGNTYQISYLGPNGNGNDVVLKVLAVTVPNLAPTALTLSPLSVSENAGANAVVGTFTTTDPNPADTTFTYSLVTGTGDTNNGLFNISGNTLRATGSLNFEAQPSYSVRVRTTDTGGLFFENTFTINVTDVNEGFTVTPTTGLTTTETSGTATFTIVLNSPPTADVTIALSSSDTTEGAVSPASVTFTTANWNVAQTITVTGVDDNVADGNVPYTIVTAAATSTDLNYDGVNAADVAVTTTDNDTVGVTVTPATGLTTTEVGGTATFTIVLTSQPTADVTIPLSSSDATEGSVSPASVTFTPANWNVAQMVTVTGVDDSLADGPVAYTIVTGPATSTDLAYNNFNAADAAVSNTDNDVVGITVSPLSGLTTTEAGGIAVFTVALTSQPTANVNVPLSSGDATEGTVSPASLTFTPANWNIPQTVTVTGADDLLADGNVAYTVVTAAATSADPGYNGFDAANVAVTNIDNDVAGITVAPTTPLTTTEAGASATFTIVLNAEPTANVTIALASNDTTEGNVSPASVTFTPANWNIAQTVTVTGTDDFLADGTISYTIVTSPAASTDPAYNGLNAVDVSVTNTDNDTVGVTVTPTTGLTTTEASGTATFTVVLTSQPAADVTIPLSSSDTTEGNVSPASLTFTPANWSVPQTVTVTGVDDNIIDVATPYTIITGAANSADAAYNNFAVADVALSNTDNDVAGVTVTQSGGTTVVVEAGATDTVSLSLASQPAANVTITTSGGTQLTSAPSSLTFTPANWNTPQTATITAVNDATAEGSHTGTLSFTAASSDAAYNGLVIGNVTVQISDPAPFAVSTFANTGSSFSVRFTEALDPARLNLVDSNNVLGPSDITITGATTGVVRGSVIMDADNRGFTFVKTGGELAPDTYTVTLRSAANGVATAAGVPLDGDGNSTPGGDYVTQFTVAAPAAGTIVVGVPDFVRGYGQAVNVPATSTSGIPITLSSGVNVGSASFTLHYNPALLTISGGSTPLAGASISVSVPAPGTVVVTVSRTTEFSSTAGPITIANLTATVPSTASNGSKHLLDVSDVSISAVNATPLPSAADDGIHIAAYRGDLNNNRAITTGDVTALLRAQSGVQSTTGFTALKLSDPILLGDMNDTSTLTTGDATALLQFLSGSGGGFAGIPALPPGLPAPAPGADPEIFIPDNLQVTQGGNLVVPININVTEPTGITLAGFDVTFTYDPARFTVGSITTGDALNGFTFLDSGNNDTPGTVRLVYSAAQGPALANGFVGTLVNVTLTAIADAAPGSSALNVTAAGASDNTTADLTIAPAVTAANTDPSDGSVTVNLANAAPTAVNLNPQSLSENAGPNAVVGALSTTDPDAGDTFTYTFASGLGSADNGLFNISGSTLRATSSLNFESQQTYSVRIRSTDAGGLSVENTFTISVNDVNEGVTVTPTAGLTTTEAGGMATFTIVLNSQPAANVTIALSSSDTTEGTVSPASVIFTGANWNTPQVVTITGVNDASFDGAIAYTIITGATSSTDPAFNNLVVDDVAVTNNDDEAAPPAGISVSPTSGLTTTEAGGVAVFTIVLNSQPTADVTIPLTSSDLTEGSVSPASVIFTPTNWNVPQTVTVTGQDDASVDGNVTYMVTTSAATSTDSNYNGVNAADVSLTNADNEAATPAPGGITVTPTTGLTTTEGGGGATFTIVLNTQPTADVTIALSSSDTSEGTVAPASVVFTSANWNTPQIVTVTGADDAIADGAVAYTIVTAAATSADANYNGVNAADVAVVNTDDEPAPPGGITVSPTSGLTTTEAGGVAVFTIVLTTQPTASVTIPLSSSDTTEGTVSAATVTFTAANWNVPQTVTVTGQDDASVDGNVAYMVTTGDATSTDPSYTGINAVDVSLTNSDDETGTPAQGSVTVAPTSGLITTEGGNTATFTIVLNSQPTANVTIPLSSSDTTEGTVSPTSVTFTPANWNVAQTITITGVDDTVVDGAVAYTIVTGEASSTDPAYSNLVVADVAVSNADNDLAGITITPTTGLTTTEAGGTATFTIVLNSQPSGAVTIPLSTNNPAEGTVSPASVTFTPANWNVPQTVTITGVNDFVDDGAVAYSIVTGAATSGDANYNGLDAANVAVSNTDNDSAGVTVTPTAGLTTTEAGGTATFTIVLNSQPTADVTIALSSSNPAEGTVAPASVVFTALNWNTPQSVVVTGVDDAVADGAIAYTIVTGPATSADAAYDNLVVADVNVSNADDEAPPAGQITVSPTSGLTTTEAGGIAIFTIVLTSQPTADVTIPLASSDPTEGTLSAASVTFTPANWNVAQTVTVTGADDALVDGNVIYSVTTSAATSTDTNYNGVNAADVSLTNTDNEAPTPAGITVSPTSGLTTTEGGGAATFTIVLNTQPTANVTIALSSSDATEGAVSPASVTFTAANWNSPQTVTVTGLDDAAVDGAIAYTIVTAAASSADANYNGLNAADVAVTNSDNEAAPPAGISVSPISGLTTTEAGGVALFTIVLNSQPTAAVTIPLASTDSTEGAVSAASVTFTPANWNVPQTVTVTGLDDALVDGNVAYMVTTGAATSTDLGYSGINAADVSLTNVDNEAATPAGITVTPTSGLTTTEAGGAATFTIVLNTQPTANVTIPLTSSDATEGAVSPASVTFTPANWNTPQTVTVTGADDLIVDGNVSYTVITGAATSADGSYNGVNAADVAITNNDNDVVAPTPGLTITPTAGLTTTETGGTATFTVVLNTQPTATVTIPLTSSDPGEGTLSTSSVVFTAQNWNVPQTVTITGVDDGIDDGDAAYSIITGLVTSSDPAYQGLNPQDLSATNINNGSVGDALPTISEIDDQETDEETELSDVAFTVDDAETAADDLTVTAISSNTTLFPDGSITLGGSGANRTISFNPALNQSGMATITVTVEDAAGNTSSDTFAVTVNPVNDEPTLNPISNPATLPLNSGVQTINLSGISAGGGETQTLTVTATSSNPALIPDPTVNYTSPNATGTLSFTPVANQSGAATITVTVTDDGGEVTTRTFTVTVTGNLTTPGMLEIVDDPENPGSGLLVINGTSRTDLITVVRSGANRTLVLVPLSGIYRTFENSDYSRILINGLDGNDRVIIDPLLTKPATINGDAGNDIITSGAGADVIRGGSGSDYIFGRGGDDFIFGDSGKDFLYGDEGNDVVMGGADDDRITGGSGADVLNGGAGFDTIFGGGGDDLIIGGNLSQANSLTDLQAIKALWTANQPFNTRISSLASQINSTTVTSDGRSDWIYGNEGRDWIVDYALLDLIWDFNSNTTSGDRRN